MTVDLVADGHSLVAVQLAGGWRSPAMPGHYAADLLPELGAVARYHAARRFATTALTPAMGHCFEVRFRADRRGPTLTVLGPGPSLSPNSPAPPQHRPTRPTTRFTPHSAQPRRSRLPKT